MNKIYLMKMINQKINKIVRKMQEMMKEIKIKLYNKQLDIKKLYKIQMYQFFINICRM